MPDILIIEDDPEMGPLIKDLMINEGFSARLCASAEEALELFEYTPFSIVLLDVMLPHMDGFETCTAIRQKQDIPILMMSAMTDEDSKLLGYKTGADDYIDKPFSVKVLAAKVRALMKRAPAAEKEEVLTGYGITLDKISRCVTKDGREIKLSNKEFELLQYLMEHSGEAVDKNVLFNKIWGMDCFSEMSTVSVHMRWLREKIEEDPNSPEIIRTVWKIGYRFGDKK